MDLSFFSGLYISYISIKTGKKVMTIYLQKKCLKECKVMRTNKKKNDNFVKSICKYYNKFREPC